MSLAQRIFTECLLGSSQTFLHTAHSARLQALHHNLVLEAIMTIHTGLLFGSGREKGLGT